MKLSTIKKPVAEINLGFFDPKDESVLNHILKLQVYKENVGYTLIAQTVRPANGGFQSMNRKTFNDYSSDRVADLLAEFVCGHLDARSNLSKIKEVIESISDQSVRNAFAKSMHPHLHPKLPAEIESLASQLSRDDLEI